MLPAHPLEERGLPPLGEVMTQLPRVSKMSPNKCVTLLHLLEVYVDDFVQMAQTIDRSALRHCIRTILHGIPSMFLPPAITGHSGKDPMSLKKLDKDNGLWEVQKEVVG